MTSSAPAAPVTWPELLDALCEGLDLTESAASWAMDRLMSGELTDAQIAGFLVAVRAKGETSEEIAGFSQAMMDRAEPIDIPHPTLDIVGTGGDRLGTVNISTMSSLVAAGAGVTVVKHGNRGASTTAGAADVIEALGVDLRQPIARVAEAASAVGITFLFAQQFHPAMRHVMPARQQLGVRTVFNILGPLSNPARPHAQALGCASAELAPRIAQALASRGTHGLVFRGQDGRDKITTSADTDVWEIRHGTVTQTLLSPEDFGVSRCRVEDLEGGSAAHNAGIVRDVLAGHTGPVRDAVLINAAAGLAAAAPEAQGDLRTRIQQQMERAAHAIDSGAAGDVLKRWVEFSR